MLSLSWPTLLQQVKWGSRRSCCRHDQKLNQIYPENSVDIVFAGHNHQYTNGMVGNTLIVQGTSQGKAYSDVRGS